MATYGVTTAAVAATANGLTLSSTSRPTQAQVETWITQAASMASAAIRAAGADPATVEADSTGEGYSLAAQYVTADAASLAITAQDRQQSDLARMYADRARDLLRDLRTWAGSLGDQRSTAEGAPGLAWAPYQYATDQTPTADATFLSLPSGQL